MSHVGRLAPRGLLVALFLGAGFFALRGGSASTPAEAVSTSVVISQVYGGGGNSGAPLTNDYVELFNLTSSPINLTGWSLQYASATGAFGGAGLSTALTGSIPANG